MGTSGQSSRPTALLWLGHTLDVVLHLAGTNPDAFLLYLEVDGT